MPWTKSTNGNNNTNGRISVTSVKLVNGVLFRVYPRDSFHCVHPIQRYDKILLIDFAIYKQ